MKFLQESKRGRRNDGSRSNRSNSSNLLFFFPLASDKLAFDEGHTLWHFLTRVRQSQIGSLDRKKFRDTFKLLLQVGKLPFFCVCFCFSFHISVCISTSEVTNFFLKHGASWGRYQLDSVAESFGLTEISELLAEYKNQK